MNAFQKTIAKMYGGPGKIWLKQLPHRVHALASLWGLSNLNPVPNISYNYVLTGLHGNLPIVLKIAYDQAALEREGRAGTCQ